MDGFMKTAVMTAIGKVEIQERPIPVPKENEALIKVELLRIGKNRRLYCRASLRIRPRSGRGSS